jgi:serine protease Do
MTAEPPAREQGRGYGPYLGVVPDFAASPEPGVVLQGVRANSPAEGAGLRPGDRIVEFDGAPIANLQELHALLLSARPGQRVGIVVIRDGNPVHTEASLGQRR